MRMSRSRASALGRGERLVVMSWEACGSAGLMIERRLQLTLKEKPDTPLKDRLGVEPAGQAQAVEPTQPRGDMADLVAIDTAQDFRTPGIAHPLELRHHLRGHVEPARF